MFDRKGTSALYQFVLMVLLGVADPITVSVDFRSDVVDQHAWNLHLVAMTIDKDDDALALGHTNLNHLCLAVDDASIATSWFRNHEQLDFVIVAVDDNVERSALGVAAQKVAKPGL